MWFAQQGFDFCKVLLDVALEAVAVDRTPDAIQAVGQSFPAVVCDENGISCPMPQNVFTTTLPQMYRNPSNSWHSFLP